MRHVRPVSQRRPVKAQFQPAIEFLGLKQAIKGGPLSLLGQATNNLNTFAQGLNTVFGMIQTLLTYFGITPP